MLSNDADVARALEKDKEILSPKFGQRYVRVMSADDLSPEELVRINGMVGPQVRASMPSSMSTHSAGAGSGVVKVDGLPQAITASELLQLFWGIRVLPAATVLHRPVDQPGNTHAYLDFGSAASAAHVIANWNGTVMTTSAGVFTLSVKASTKAELERAQGECGGENAVVKVRGLPIRATIQDLAAFFSGYMVKKNGIHLQPVGDNRHSKVAYVEFETVEEATRSLVSGVLMLGWLPFSFSSSINDAGRPCLASCRRRTINFWARHLATATASSSA